MDFDFAYAKSGSTHICKQAWRIRRTAYAAHTYLKWKKVTVPEREYSTTTPIERICWSVDVWHVILAKRVRPKAYLGTPHHPYLHL